MACTPFLPGGLTLHHDPEEEAEDRPVSAAAKIRKDTDRHSSTPPREETPPGDVVLGGFDRAGDRASRDVFFSRHRMDIEKTGLDDWLLRYHHKRSHNYRLWAVGLGGGVVGVVGVWVEGAWASSCRPDRAWVLGLYLEPGSRRKKVGFLAAVAALAELWRIHPGAPVKLTTPEPGGMFRMSMPDHVLRFIARAGFRKTIEPSQPPSSYDLLSKRQYSAYSARLSDVCAPLRAGRRALAWALVRATRQASPHPLAAFLRRYPGLLRVVGRRVLAYWCYPADIYHRHLLSHLYPLRG